MKRNENLTLIDSNLLKYVDVFHTVLVDIAGDTVLPEVYDIFGPELAIRFLDVFSGCSFQVPSRKVIEGAARKASVFVDMCHLIQDQRYGKRESAERLVDKYGLSAAAIESIYDRYMNMIDRNGKARKEAQ